MDTGREKKKQLINISEKTKEFGREWCKILLGAYVYTGEDCLSAFKDKGKFAPLKKLIKYPKIYSALSKFGEEGIVPEDVTK